MTKIYIFRMGLLLGSFIPSAPERIHSISSIPLSRMQGEIKGQRSDPCFKFYIKPWKM